MNRVETATAIDGLIGECKKLQARLDEVHSNDGGDLDSEAAEFCSEYLDSAVSCLREARNTLVEIDDDDVMDTTAMADDDLDDVDGD